MDKKTTSVFQSFGLGAAFGNFANQLVVRPPANMKVFRCTVYVCPDQDGVTNAGIAYISNQQMTSQFDGVMLSCQQVFDSTNEVPTDANVGNTYLAKNYIIFDRRGVGYMQDNFYCFGKCYINFIWEGEIS